MIRPCRDTDLPVICEIINDAALAYKGHIPADRWKEPYMPQDELEEEIRRGVVFYCVEEGGEIIGVMGVQDVLDVTLIRHAYVRTSRRRGGIGAKLLRFLTNGREGTVLIGTWKDASWAIGFYLKNGFRLVDEEEKTRLLNTYWSIPERQVATSVVLVNH